MKKNVSAIAILLVVIVTILGGCSNSENMSSKAIPTSTSTPPPTSTATPTATPKTDIFDDVVEEVNGYRRFKMTRAEFIERYNQFAHDKQLATIDIKNNETTPADTSAVIEKDKSNGAAKIYSYKFTNALTFSQEIGFMVDKDDYILQVIYSELASSLKNNGMERLYNDFLHIMYSALFKTITTSDIDTEIKTIRQDRRVLHSTWLAGISEVKNVDEGALAVQISIISKE